MASAMWRRLVNPTGCLPEKPVATFSLSNRYNVDVGKISASPKFFEASRSEGDRCCSKISAAYAHYLKTVRGGAASTIQQNSYTASRFLAYLKVEKQPGRLKSLTVKDLEAFVKAISPHVTAGQACSTCVGRLRSFFRFLAVTGEIPQGLDRQIDGPRVYQEEQLPQTLPWETVQSLLNSIDRSSPTGHRDFTMFLLMATYGLRASDVVALTLDDIRWRAGKISISQRKTGTALELPLTDTVGTALYRYLKKAPPPPPFRQIFLRVKAPIGALKTSALSIAFRVWARRSGVDTRERIVPSHSAFLCCVSPAEGHIGQDNWRPSRPSHPAKHFHLFALGDRRSARCCLARATRNQTTKAVRA